MAKAAEKFLSKKNIWLIIALVLAVLGVAVSIYQTDHHLVVEAAGESDFVCNINQTFSCDEVVKSPYSEFLTIPLGVWGLAYFLALALLLCVALF